MMIRLLLEKPPPKRPVSLGPAPWFRIGGNFIRVGPHGTIGGTYRQHQWEVQAQYFTRWDCRERVLVHFEDAAGGATQDYGPFSESYAADGVMHVDNKLFAKFVEESQLWHCYPTENFWPVMILKPAES
jgi:hypothetical protein